MIHVASRESVLRRRDLDAFAAVVSLNGKCPFIDAPPNVAAHANALVLHFDDILGELEEEGVSGLTPPHRDDVVRILGFARRNPRCETLIHCHAGVSRSGAAAVIVQAVWDLREAGEVDGAGLAALVERFQLFPNELMIHLADRELGLRPTLWETVEPAVRKVWGWL